MKVEFSNVGMNNMNWTANIKELSFDSLYRQVKNKGALGSRDVDFSFDEKSQTGCIIVGMFRKVGEFKVLAS